MAPTNTLSPAEVVADPGLLFVAPVGTTEPTATAAADIGAAGASLPSAWRHVGYTDEGSTHTWDISSEGLYVAEELSPIRQMLTQTESKLAFKMAQASRRNAALALNLGAAAASAGTVLEPPDPSAMLRVMLLWVSNDDLATRGVLFRQCFNITGWEMNRSKAPNKTLIDVEFAQEIPSSGAAPFVFIPNAAGVI